MLNRLGHGPRHPAPGRLEAIEVDRRIAQLEQLGQFVEAAECQGDRDTTFSNSSQGSPAWLVGSIAAIKYLPIIVLIAIIAIYAFNRDI